ncbi:ABC transporter substrate-binding protein, partial [Brevibacterium sp. 2SA]
PSAPLTALHRTTAARRLGAAVLTVLLALTASGCGVGMGSAKTIGKDDTITVGVIPVGDYASIYIAADEGYFAEEGLNVETKVMQSASAIAPSVINGQLQFGTSATPPLAIAYEKGLPLEIVANAASNAPTAEADPTAIVVGSGSPIQRPRDLEGKTVAINALGAITQIGSAAAVRADGGDPTKVDYVVMSLPDGIAAVESGRVDAASTAEPFQGQVVAAGGRIISHPLFETFPPKATFAVAFTAKPFAEANPEVVDAFVRAVNRANEKAATDPETVRKVLTKYGKLAPSVAETMLLPSYSTQVDADAVQTTADLMTDLGFLPGPVDTKGLMRP